MHWFSAVLSSALFIFFGVALGEEEPELDINQIQVVGTHNSYHVKPSEALLAVIAPFAEDLALSLQYSHVPLRQQLREQQVRQFELDLYYDPEGGDYSLRRGNIAIGESPDPGIPALKKPGLKVLHIQDIDYGTTCITFKDCLQEIKTWSEQNPSHVPLMIQIQANDDAIMDPLNIGFTVPKRFSKKALDSIDEEILSVFEPSHLITPDMIRGTAESLEEVVTTRGWPSLASSRGKILFFLLTLCNDPVLDRYIEGHEALSGRVMFTNSPPGTPEAAIINMDFPNVTMIQELVSNGYMVRTRSDDFTVEARTGDTSRRDLAFATGAHWISTDYPVPDPRLGTGFQVALPEGKAVRCNPVTAPEGCRVSDVLSRLKPGARCRKFTALLDSQQEVPPLKMKKFQGLCKGLLRLDSNKDRLFYKVGCREKLLGLPVAAHIHQGAVGVNGGVIVPLDIISTRQGRIVEGNIKASVIGNEKFIELVALIFSEGAYFNIHTTKSQSGEVRGQIIPPSECLSTVV